MNSASLRVVSGRHIASVLAVALGTFGCTEVNGGAVELSWSLHDQTSGDLVGCGAVVRMRLVWQLGTDPEEHDSWRCDARSGVTTFEVPPGEVTLWVQPECAPAGAMEMLACPETYEAPAPLERTITLGDVTTLNAVQVLVDREGEVRICMPACASP